jgi:hypothetical protein
MDADVNAASLTSPRPGQQQNITLAASTGQYSDAVIRVGSQYQVRSNSWLWQRFTGRAPLTVSCMDVLAHNACGSRGKGDGYSRFPVATCWGPR